jgi:hypothetical protein
MIVVGGALQYHSVHAGILKSTDHLRWQPAGILWAGIEKG